MPPPPGRSSRMSSISPGREQGAPPSRPCRSPSCSGAGCRRARSWRTPPRMACWASAWKGVRAERARRQRPRRVQQLLHVLQPRQRRQDQLRRRRQTRPSQDAQVMISPVC
uniref:Uncharacterized protein n=1 Tax=Arundo donax TaxID=35708 RepID=A0A0A8Z165_ARUDO